MAKAALSLHQCPACRSSKSHRLPSPSSPHRSNKPLSLIFCDVWGPSPIISVDGFRYYVSFVDDYSHYIWFFRMKSKNEVQSIFLSFRTLVENLFNSKICYFQSDWGGEFRSFHKLFPSLGIHHRISCPHTHTQNGTVERRHRTIVETGLSLLSHSHAPQSYWTYAFSTATYLINRLPSPTLHNKSPYQLLYHSKPNYTFLRVFGSTC